jgi:hypothetical protein
MIVENVLRGCLDAADYENASLAILAHPRSIILSGKTIDRLVDFACFGEIPTGVDVAMVKVLGDLMLAKVEVPA